MKMNFQFITKRKIRLAIVGCGRISKNHFNAVQKHQENIELVSVCDDQQAVLSDHESKYKDKGYLNLSDMLKNEDLDLVVLAL